MTPDELVLTAWLYLVAGGVAAGISHKPGKPWQELAEVVLFWPLAGALGLVFYRARRIAEWRRRRRERQLPRARAKEAGGWR